MDENEVLLFEDLMHMGMNRVVSLRGRSGMCCEFWEGLYVLVGCVVLCREP